MNTILCPSCKTKLYPNGVEEKTCSHGCFGKVVCTECGAVRAEGDVYWHCLGGVPTSTPTGPTA